MLMEVAERFLIILRFNPCFGGNQKSNLARALILVDVEFGFNPCFGGNQKSNKEKEKRGKDCEKVSILVLVEIRNQILIFGRSRN